MWIAIIILCLLLGVSIYVIVNLLRKIEEVEDIALEDQKYLQELESWMQMFTHRVNDSYSRMRAIDRLGGFESDDEVGFVFKELKSIIEDVAVLTKQKGDDDNTTEEER